MNYLGDKEVIDILNNIQKSAIQIKKILSLSFLQNIELINDNYNVHDEKQKKIDLLSNNIIKNGVLSHNTVHSLCSEEETTEKIIQIKSNKKLIFVYDPLDGSSNVENNMPTGTIFGLYKDNINFDNTLSSINRINDLVLAGYVLYSSSIHLVFYYHYNIYHFIYDEDLKDFILYDENIKIPDFGNIYSINEAKINNFDKKHKNYLEKLKNENYCSRYYGCLVADFHNILINGGIFMYPENIKEKKNKIRLLYEAKPLAKIMNFAGGLFTDDIIDINKKKINNIHETTPIYFGSKNNINDFENYCKNLENNIDK